ncbi:hypothetical protein HF313_16940 [Massilia atriviolacea]|uniref:Uncharacterized protein n=1 Tax=Massilia atriviolacea TaxID=2495579 RepID=A0A430HUG5_9BURK|nr:hypothetical protein [Massilia atriviolacea]RSZ61014.1 hypothetical protein EJB06_02485 [Massilia atriviolacea]
MPFGTADEAINPAKSIYLMTATLKNDYHSSYQPKAIVLHVERGAAADKADRINYTMDTLARAESDAAGTGNTYYLRMELEQGQYTVRSITGMVQSFPIIATFSAPLHAQLDAATPGVYYLGHVDATVRERVGNEFKAGPSIPLIDQAVAGASGGTFDVAVSDRWARDESEFKRRFPVLKSATIGKAILPAFDRPKAQAFWEAN